MIEKKTIDGYETLLYNDIAHAIIKPDALINKEVVLSGSPRTGTTLAWRILSHLFHTAWKTHEPVDFRTNNNAAAPPQVFLTYRDPRDVLVSRWRVAVDNFPPAPDYWIPWPDNDNMYQYMPAQHFDWLLEHLGREMSQSQYLKLYKELYGEKNVFCLQYEKFNDNLDYIYDIIEDIYLVEITHEQRSYMNNNFGKEAAIKLQLTFTEFSQGDHHSGLHGRHVYVGKKKNWKDWINPKHIDKLNETYASELRLLGYTI